MIRRGITDVGALSESLGVSTATIRRDLLSLSKEGTIVRTYGGAALLNGRFERNLQERAEMAREEKGRIAVAALEHVPRSGIVYLDAGSTVGGLAELIVSHDQRFDLLTVVTHSLSVVSVLSSLATIEMVVLGGNLRKVSQGMLGPITEQAVEAFRFDVAFLGSDSVSAEYGLGEMSLAQVRLKSQVIARSRLVVALADGSKIEQSPTPYWAPFHSGLLISDGLEEQTIRAFESSGIAVQLV